MKKIILSISIYASYSLHSQNLTCNDFKNGKFELINKEIGNSIIIRKGNKQQEKMLNEKRFTTYRVQWIDDCTYMLTLTRKTKRKYPELPKNACLTVKIISTSKNSYIQTSTSNFSDMELTNEMIRLTQITH